MPLITESYLAQNARWPQSGRHILAQYDDESIIVYQAYRPAIGHFAARHSYFGGEFSLTRMSWIKPNFLWSIFSILQLVRTCTHYLCSPVRSVSSQCCHCMNLYAKIASKKETREPNMYSLVSFCRNLLFYREYQLQSASPTRKTIHVAAPERQDIAQACE